MNTGISVLCYLHYTLFRVAIAIAPDPYESLSPKISTHIGYLYVLGVRKLYREFGNFLWGSATFTLGTATFFITAEKGCFIFNKKSRCNSLLQRQKEYVSFPETPYSVGF